MEKWSSSCLGLGKGLVVRGKVSLNDIGGKGELRDIYWSVSAVVDIL